MKVTITLNWKDHVIHVRYGGTRIAFDLYSDAIWRDCVKEVLTEEQLRDFTEKKWYEVGIYEVAIAEWTRFGIEVATAMCYRSDFNVPAEYLDWPPREVEIETQNQAL